MRDYTHFTEEELLAAIEYCEAEKQRCLDIGFNGGTWFWDSFLDDLYKEKNQRLIRH